MRRSLAFLVGCLPLLAIAAEPARFSDPLQVEVERTKITEDFARKANQIKDRSNPAYQAALTTRNESLTQLAAAAEEVHSAENVPLTRIYILLERYDEAVGKAQFALEANPLDHVAHFLLVNSLCRANQLDQAATEFGKLTALDVEIANARTFLADAQQPAFLLVNSLVVAGKLDEAEQTLAGWQAQLDRIASFAKSQPNLEKDLNLSLGTAATLAGKIRIKKNVESPNTQGSAKRNKVAGINSVEADARRQVTVPKPSQSPAELEAMRAAQRGANPARSAPKRPDSADVNRPSSPPLSRSDDPAVAKSRMPVASRPAENQSGSLPSSREELATAAQRAARVGELPKRPTPSPKATDATGPATTPMPSSADAPDTLSPSTSRAPVKSEPIPTKPSPPSVPLNPKARTAKENALAAQRAAQAATGKRPDLSGLKQKVSSAVDNVNKSPSVAQQLLEINRKYLEKINTVNIPPVVFEPGSSQEEMRLAKESRDEQWRQSPRVQEAESERKAALTQLAAESEAAKSVEHSPLTAVYSQLLRYDDAIREGTAVLQEQPGNIAIRALLIDIYVGKNRYNEAFDLWREGVNLNPAEPAAQVAWLEAQCSHGRVIDAGTAYRLWLGLPIPANAAEAYLIAVQPDKVVPKYFNLLCLDGRLADAEQAIKDLSIKISSLERASSKPLNTTSAKAVLEEWKQRVALARKARK